MVLQSKQKDAVVSLTVDWAWLHNIAVTVGLIAEKKFSQDFGIPRLRLLIQFPRPSCRNV
jgi:hypothetical protein